MPLNEKNDNRIAPWNYFHKLTSPYNKVCNCYNAKSIGYSGHDAPGTVLLQRWLIQLARCKFKVPMHRIFDNFFYWQIWKTVKNEEESSLLFVNICFRSRDMNFQSLGNLEKNAKRKLSILCPFNENCDVTIRICIYSMFKSDVIQTFLVRIK